MIFSPQKKLVWVSSNPYQLGEFVCYDLNEVFSDERLKSGKFSKSEFNIAKDSFADSQEFRNYEEFKKLSSEFDDENKVLSEEFINHYQSLNPDFWLGYYLAGKYYFKLKDYQRAKTEFEKALTKEITTVPDKKNVEKYLKKVFKKMR